MVNCVDEQKMDVYVYPYPHFPLLFSPFLTKFARTADNNKKKSKPQLI